MEVYIDHMVVKSKRAEDHLIHLNEAFAILRNIDKSRPDKGDRNIPDDLNSKKKVQNFSSKLTLEVEKETIATLGSSSGIWTLYTDRASNESGSGLGLALKVHNREIVRQAIKCPKITNNEAEYEAVLAGLKLALEYGVKSIKLHYDSQLVVNQVNGTFSIKEPRMQKYQTQISNLFAKFKD
ncbi:uncharacterized protein LOC132630695 [Lycium barbarum]|uniref:uncharacterized protein LOC132630695 n=1 Tax=Lycium barbarum TaxID=112863 RepID=UPI00293F73DB|nr:uncharacterized protein LOC132630695 [Lycium barbarum]